jgi:hypothetical protein
MWLIWKKIFDPCDIEGLDVFVNSINILDVIGVGHIIDGDVGAKSLTPAVTRSSTNNWML